MLRPFKSADRGDFVEVTAAFLGREVRQQSDRERNGKVPPETLNQKITPGRR